MADEDTKRTKTEQNNDSIENSLESLKRRIVDLEEENARLKRARTQRIVEPVQVLSKEHIERYSRQLLLENGFGVSGQCKLLSSSVLVVGAGGIGSTVLLYLAAAGVGKLSIVDYDRVESSNLHRQIIHRADRVGMNKAASATNSVLDLNPTIHCEALQMVLDHSNALQLIEQFDCVVDASDNPKTRYLINDTCVLANKPLVSGSAVGTDGQLTVYNWKDSPCYRCLYPKPAASAGCASCSDAGVLGPVPGLIGILQSMEVIKILTDVGTSMNDRLMMYDSLRCSFYSIKKPKKSSKCPICGPDATIRTMEDSLNNLVAARGPSITNVCQFESLPEGTNISCADYQKYREQGTPHILLDVRVAHQFAICSLEGSINIPLGKLSTELDRIQDLCEGTKPVFCLCRRGAASSQAAKALLEANLARVPTVKNIAGGLTAWHDQVDSFFPKY